MSKSITIKLNDDAYTKFHKIAKGENRSISNLIATFAMKQLEKELLTDPFETSEIHTNKSLLTKLKKGHQDAVHKKGRLIG